VMDIRHRIGVWAIISTVFFILLLPWPLFGFLAYVFLPQSVRMIVAFGFIGIEVIVGTLMLSLWIRVARNPIKRIVGRRMVIISIALNLIFLSTVGYVYVIQ
jgi:hypothetical protein